MVDRLDRWQIKMEGRREGERKKGREGRKEGGKEEHDKGKRDNKLRF